LQGSLFEHPRSKLRINVLLEDIGFTFTVDNNSEQQGLGKWTHFCSNLCPLRNKPVSCFDLTRWRENNNDKTRLLTSYKRQHKRTKGNKIAIICPLWSEFKEFENIDYKNNIKFTAYNWSTGITLLYVTGVGISLLKSYLKKMQSGFCTLM
jgi:hypothetical protein